MRLCLAAYRAFARKPVSKPFGPEIPNPPGFKEDPELMAIVKKHIDANLAMGMTPEEVIKTSFGPEIMQKVPDDPDKLKTSPDGTFNLKNLSMELSPELLSDLKGLKSRREAMAKQQSKETQPLINTTQKVDLPKGYKKSDIEKRIEKMRMKEEKKKTDR